MLIVTSCVLPTITVVFRCAVLVCNQTPSYDIDGQCKGCGDVIAPGFRYNSYIHVLWEVCVECITQT